MSVLLFALGCGAAACLIGGVVIRSWQRDQEAKPRSERWDSTNAEVAEWGAVLRGEVLDVNGVPVVIGRSPLLPPQPDDDLIAQAERAAEFEWLKTYLLTSLEQRYLRPGRHRLYAERDPRLAALLEPTQTFAALVEAETGEPLADVGPREAELRCVRTAGFVEAVAS